MGFELSWKFTDEASHRETDAFWDRFIGEVERRSLLFGGGGAIPEGGGFVTRPSPPGATAADRENLLAWLRADPLVASTNGSDLVDAWDPPEPV